jgi:hypothetical protein
MVTQKCGFIELLQPESSMKVTLQDGLLKLYTVVYFDYFWSAASRKIPPVLTSMQRGGPDVHLWYLYSDHIPG